MKENNLYNKTLEVVENSRVDGSTLHAHAVTRAIVPFIANIAKTFSLYYRTRKRLGIIETKEQSFELYIQDILKL